MSSTSSPVAPGADRDRGRRGARGRQAVHRRAVRGPEGTGRPRRQETADYPVFPDYAEDVYTAVADVAGGPLARR